MPPPAQPSTIPATDESMLIRLGADYAQLCPDWQKTAAGSDGVLDSASWTLTSASVDFESCGVGPNRVIRFDRPSAVFRGAGEWFAVESAATIRDGGGAFAAGVLTLRRAGAAVGEGQPPPTVSDVQFTSLTFQPQLQEAAFRIYQRFNIDESDVGREPENVRDLHVIRDAVVLTVMAARYLVEARDRSSDFWPKYGEVKRELSECLDAVRVRWGTAAAEARPSSSIFSMRCER